MQPIAEVASTEVTSGTSGSTGRDFEVFYRGTYAGTVRVLVALTGRMPVAEEITQEAMVAAFRRWDAVSELERPDLWLRRVAVNRAISRHRRLIAEVAALGRLRSERPRADHIGIVDDQVWSAVRSLPKTQATAIVLWSIDGYTLAEVGEVLGCSEETARTHLRRARKRLAEVLEVDDGA